MAVVISNATPTVIATHRVPTTHAASLNYWYNFSFGDISANAVTGSGWAMGLMETYLLAGYSVRVYDAAAIAAAADDMTTILCYIEYDV